MSETHRPFVRLASDSTDIPDGWVAQPIGRLGTEKAEIVLDPRRHEIMIYQGDADQGLTVDSLSPQGWELQATDDHTCCWTRDKSLITHQVLDQLQVGARETPYAKGLAL